MPGADDPFEGSSVTVALNTESPVQGKNALSVRPRGIVWAIVRACPRTLTAPLVDAAAGTMSSRSSFDATSRRSVARAVSFWRS
jgi:hypothetical protein